MAIYPFTATPKKQNEKYSWDAEACPQSCQPCQTLTWYRHDHQYADVHTKSLGSLICCPQPSIVSTAQAHLKPPDYYPRFFIGVIFLRSRLIHCFSATTLSFDLSRRAASISTSFARSG